MSIDAAFQGSLFASDFLRDAITRSPDWQELDDASLEDLKAALRAICDRFPAAVAPNESQTEDDLIWPVLARLGWTASLRQQNLSAYGRVDVPDGLLFADEATKGQANGFAEEWRRYELGLAVVESKRWQRPLDPQVPDQLARSKPCGVGRHQQGAMLAVGGQGGIVELAVPVGDRQLTGDDRQAAAEAVVEDFEEVACPRGVDRRQTPVVEDEQLDAGEVAVELRDGALSMGDPQIGEQPRHTQIPVSRHLGSVRRFVLGPFCQTLTNLSPKMTANCVLASNHSRGGRFHASAA